MFLRLVLTGHRLTLRAGARRTSGRHILLAQRGFPHMAQGIRHRDTVLRITNGDIGRRREVGMITVSKGGNCPPVFFLGMACRSLYLLSLWCLYIFSSWKIILN